MAMTSIFFKCSSDCLLLVCCNVRCAKHNSIVINVKRIKRHNEIKIDGFELCAFSYVRNILQTKQHVSAQQDHMNHFSSVWVQYILSNVVLFYWRCACMLWLMISHTLSHLISFYMIESNKFLVKTRAIESSISFQLIWQSIFLRSICKSCSIIRFELKQYFHMKYQWIYTIGHFQIDKSKQ